MRSFVEILVCELCNFVFWMCWCTSAEFLQRLSAPNTVHWFYVKHMSPLAWIYIGLIAYLYLTAYSFYYYFLINWPIMKILAVRSLLIGTLNLSSFGNAAMFMFLIPFSAHFFATFFLEFLCVPNVVTTLLNPLFFPSFTLFSFSLSFSLSSKKKNRTSLCFFFKKFYD